MARCQHHRYCRQLWLRQDLLGCRDRGRPRSTLGRDSLDGPFISLVLYPWRRVAQLRSQDSFYKSLLPDESAAAFRNEYDFDSPDAVDFDLLVEKLLDIKQGSAHSVFPATGGV